MNLPQKQSGAVLIIGLLILLVMTVLGITGMSTTSIQERMAGNDRDRQIAFQAAEAALRHGEDFIRNASAAALASSNFTATCTNGLCARIDTGSTDNWLVTTNWTTSGKHRVYDMVNTSEIIEDPKYIIEALGKVIIPPATSPCPTCDDAYRITALGTGSTLSSRVMLQSVFVRAP